MRHNGTVMIPGMPPMQAQPGPQMVLASPFNDTQLVAMMAASVYTRLPSAGMTAAGEAVETAVDLVAHSIAAVQAGTLQKRVEALLGPAAGR